MHEPWLGRSATDSLTGHEPAEKRGPTSIQKPRSNALVARWEMRLAHLLRAYHVPVKSPPSNREATKKRCEDLAQKVDYQLGELSELIARANEVLKRSRQIVKRSKRRKLWT